MIILKATNESLAITTGAVGQIDYSISYADITTTAFSPSTSEGQIMTIATPTVLSNPPDSSTQRQVKLITITNSHASTTNTVILKKVIIATEYYLTPVVTLLAGESFQFVDGVGWRHYLANGLLGGSLTAPNGTDTLVQFNDGGSQLGTDSDFLFNKTNNHLEIGTASNEGALVLGYNTVDESPESGKMLLYGKNIAGRVMPKWVGPAGIDNPIQSCIGFNGIKQVAPATGTTAATCMTALATAFTNSATTYTQVAVTSGSIMSRMRSVTLATSGTAGNLASHRTPQYEVCGVGGYYFMSRFYVGGTIRSGQRGFHGLAGRTTAFTNVNPLTEFATAKIGLAYALAGVNGNWNIVASTTTAAMTAIDLGAGFVVNTTDVIELALFCRPAGVSSASPIGYRVTNLTTPAVATGTLTNGLPIATLPLSVHHWVTNNATGAVATFGLNKWYLESDY